MSWFDYIFTHLFPTWVRSFNDNFVMWRDLVTEDYDKYTLIHTGDPFEECYGWFWSSINLDETYPKEFLESLQKLVADVESGKVTTVPWTQEMDDELDELYEDD